MNKPVTTLSQIDNIDEFLLKRDNLTMYISDNQVFGEDILCVRIGNKSQLGTLLSRIEQITSLSIPHLFSLIENIDFSSYKYLILESTKS